MFQQMLLIVFLQMQIYISASDLSEYLGFAISTALQSSQVPPSTVGIIVDEYVNAKTFRLFQTESSPQIAEQILAQSSTPSEIKFIIPFWEVNNVTAFTINHTLNRFSSIRSNIWCICLGNEPDLLYWPAFDTLASKLEFMYQYLASTSEWNHVKVTIPFSGAIFGEGGTFQEKWQSNLTQILQVLQQYDGPFSMNLHVFYDLIYGEGGYSAEKLQYALGQVKGDKYDTLLEQLYDRAAQAIYNSIGSNDVDFILTETGWPTTSSQYSFATTANAKQYIASVLTAMNNTESVLYHKTVVFFELFDENGKGGFHTDGRLTEKHWGVYDRHVCAKYYVSGLIEKNVTQQKFCEAGTRSTLWNWKFKLVIWITCAVIVILLMAYVVYTCWNRKQRVRSAFADSYQTPLVTSSRS
eukprot:10521_1